MTNRTAASAADRRDRRSRAACRDVDPDTVFRRGPEAARAKAVCAGCPVRGGAWMRRSG